jgi:hypothetical protein
MRLRLRNLEFIVVLQSKLFVWGAFPPRNTITLHDYRIYEVPRKAWHFLITYQPRN